LSHRRLLLWSSALDWVGGAIVSAAVLIGKREKNRIAAQSLSGINDF
jgi:hypothetical protein